MTVVPRLPAIAADRARTIVERFSSTRILVVGDLMLDQFLVGRVERISPEAPVPVVAFDHEETRIGGAANVAHNVVMLGGAVDLCGAAGEDEANERLQAALRRHRIATSGIVLDRQRRTTTKVRVVTTRNQQVARIDYESDAELTGETEAALLARLDDFAPEAGAIVVSDYLKGVVTLRVMRQLAEVAQQRRMPVLVDPKIPHLGHYAGATWLKPNHREAELATHRRIRSPEDAREAAAQFRHLTQCEAVLMTLGEHGMWLLDPRHDGHLAATAREVADVTGAGDTVIATLALALAAGASSPEAASLANHAAAVVVGKFGPATVTPAELVHEVLTAGHRK
jgi:D-beta-D-heptose 7-phosphate kinase/D-beta-D-heptose 1-phosphate adenosyltransferase